MAVTNEKDLEKERTMGRKFIVPTACTGWRALFPSRWRKKSGFADDDLDLLWGGAQQHVRA